MSKSMGFEKIDIFPLKDMKQAGLFHHRLVYERITRGKDAEGERMPEYSEKYATLKARGFERTTKRSGNKGTKIKSMKNRSVSRQVSPPDFRLSGNTMVSFQKRKADEVTKDSYKLGWDGEAAQIVKWNAERTSKKRDVYTTVPDDELKRVADKLTTDLQKQFNRTIKDVSLVVG